MVTRKYVPTAGDLVWINFHSKAGHEQRGRRPGLVLSPEIYNHKTGLAIICPITNRQKGYSFEVPLPAGLPIGGSVLADHMKNLDWEQRQAEHAGTAPERVMEQVRTRIAALLGIADN